MNKIYKLHFKGLGKVFLLASTIFLFSGIENANAQVEIRCTSTSNANLNHSHGINIVDAITSYKIVEESYSCGMSSDCYRDVRVAVYGAPSVYAAALSVNFCNSWALFINGQQVNTVNKFLEMIPPTQLLRLYDPNMLRN